MGHFVSMLRVAIMNIQVFICIERYSHGLIDVSFRHQRNKHIRGYSTMARALAFQARYRGPIPLTRFQFQKDTRMGVLLECPIAISLLL